MRWSMWRGVSCWPVNQWGNAIEWKIYLPRANADGIPLNRKTPRSRRGVEHVICRLVSMNNQREERTYVAIACGRVSASLSDLNCFVLGDDPESVFPVDIQVSSKIGILKKSIKEETLASLLSSTPKISTSSRWDDSTVPSTYWSWARLNSERCLSPLTELRRNSKAKKLKAIEDCTLWIRSLQFSARLWRMNTSTFWYEDPLVRFLNSFLTCADLEQGTSLQLGHATPASPLPPP